MKRLFDENDRYTEEANKLSGRVYNRLRPIIEEMAEEGFSIRDIEYIAQRDVTDICLNLLLDSGCKKDDETLTE